MRDRDKKKRERGKEKVNYEPTGRERLERKVCDMVFFFG